MKKGSLIFIGYILLLLVMATQQVSDQTQEAKPSDNTSVNSISPSTIGSNSDLQVYFSNTSSTFSEGITYLGFSFNLINYKQLQSVNLRLKPKSLPSDHHPVPITIWKTSVFSEKNVTYANAPHLDGKIGSITINQYNEVSVDLRIENITQEIQTGKLYIALTTNESNLNSIIFNSKFDISDPPHVYISYVAHDLTWTNPFNNSDPVFLGFFVLILTIGLPALVLTTSMVYKRRKENRHKKIAQRSQEDQIKNKDKLFCPRCQNLVLHAEDQFCEECGENLILK